jgi:hypothetical protein
MASYVYSRNNSPSDRYESIAFQLDNGSTLVLHMGSTYDLTSGEVARARRFIQLDDTSATSQNPASSSGGNIYIAFKGESD